MAAMGYGWEDICVKLEISDRKAVGWIVLRGMPAEKKAENG
jgi:hypothetical protein